MIPELGHFAALARARRLGRARHACRSLGAARGRADWMALARPSAAAPVRARRVRLRLPGARASSATTSRCSTSPPTRTARCRLHYRIAAAWGSHEGSMLLWTADARPSGRSPSPRFSRHLPDKVVGAHPGGDGLARRSASCCSCWRPRTRSTGWSRPPADGRDLNPLLQDPGMVIHPPMLYMGYVGLSVAFSFAVAALIGGNLDATWARWTRPWTTAAWIFLTLGIALGSGWAYYELGWGGWWFWDPVENASFMPWLVGDRADPFARRHREAQQLQELDRAARDPRLLALAARHLPGPLRRALVGARVRHRPAPRPLHPRLPGGRHRRLARALRLARAERSASARASRLLSRETLLLAQQRAAASSPAARSCSARSIRWRSTRIGLGKISVGPPYFDTVFVPLLTPLVFLMGVGPLARWKETRAARPRLAAEVGGGCAVVATLLVACGCAAASASSARSGC